MNDKMDCRIIQDLMPSYIDGLTSEYTNQVIEEHIKDCEPCNQMLQRMREPEMQQENELKELDVMKKIHKKMNELLATSLISLGVVLLVIIAFVLIYNRIVPKNYQDIFKTEEAKYFYATDVFAGESITLEKDEAEEFQKLLECGIYYYEGKQGNVIEGRLITISARNELGPVYCIELTEKYKLYYNDNVYDIRDSKQLWDYLKDKIIQE